VGQNNMGPNNQPTDGQDGQERRKEDFESGVADVSQEVVDNNKKYSRGRDQDVQTDEERGGKDADPYATELATYTLEEFIKCSSSPDFVDQIIYASSEPNFNSSLEKDFFTMKSNISTRGILPTCHDRKQIMFKLLGIPQAFYRIPMPETSIRALAYIDVSGSTWEYHGVFISSILYNLESFEKVVPFSTVVDECTIDQFKSGTYKSTGGTTDCWAGHMIKNNIKQAVVYTDGYFGGPAWQTLKEDSQVQIVVVYTSNGHDSAYFNNMEERIVSQYVIDSKGNYKKI